MFILSRKFFILVFHGLDSFEEASDVVEWLSISFSLMFPHGLY